MKSFTPCPGLCPALCLALCLAFVFSAATARGMDAVSRPVSPIHHWTAGDLERFVPDWLHVKFVEGSDVRLAGRAFEDPSGRDLTASRSVLASADIGTMRRTFPGDRETHRARKAAGERRAGVLGPDLSLWFDLQVSGGPAELARVINALNACPEVEICHPAPIAEPARILGAADPAVVPIRAIPAAQGDRTPDYSHIQGYLYDAPFGLEAPSAWALPGGKGRSMKFIDVELAWTPDHEDFEHRNFFYEGGSPYQDPNYEPHGTAVLGEVIGRHNGEGIDGFAPDVRYGVVAITVSEWPFVPHRFAEAITALDPGDVWLIELQMYPPGMSATPMEWLQVNFDIIWTGVFSYEVVCVEAGANGSQNLDHPDWNGVFDRNIRDSGAIMVAAGRPNVLTAEPFTNYGSRMDAHAWGSSIVTTGYGDLYNGGTLQTRYTYQFGGTSGASPMITGAALCLQGISRAHGLGVMDPITLRSLITDTGTPHTDPTKEIGPRGNLAAAIDALLSQSSAPGIAIAPVSLLISPNPTSGPGEVRFHMPLPGSARLSVFDLQGRFVRSIPGPGLPAGDARLHWDGLDQSGRQVQSGIYFLRLDGPMTRGGGRVQVLR